MPQAIAQKMFFFASTWKISANQKQQCVRSGHSFKSHRAYDQPPPAKTGSQAVSGNG